MAPQIFYMVPQLPQSCMLHLKQEKVIKSSNCVSLPTQEVTQLERVDHHHNLCGIKYVFPYYGPQAPKIYTRVRVCWFPHSLEYIDLM